MAKLISSLIRLRKGLNVPSYDIDISVSYVLCLNNLEVHHMSMVAVTRSAGQDCVHFIALNILLPLVGSLECAAPSRIVPLAKDPGVLCARRLNPLRGAQEVLISLADL